VTETGARGRVPRPVWIALALAVFVLGLVLAARPGPPGPVDAALATLVGAALGAVAAQPAVATALRGEGRTERNVGFIVGIGLLTAWVVTRVLFGDVGTVYVILAVGAGAAVDQTWTLLRERATARRTAP
jgi:hypothetical protein